MINTRCLVYYFVPLLEGLKGSDIDIDDKVPLMAIEWLWWYSGAIYFH